MKKGIDKIDSKIIRLLQKDGRMPNTEIAKKSGISEATVRNRLDRLIKDEYIKIVAVGDPFKLGFGIAGNIKITINLDKTDHVVNELKKLDEVWYITLMTGASDLDTEFIVKSLDELRILLFDKINKIEGIIRTETAFLLQYVKNSYEWGTRYNEEDSR